MTANDVELWRGAAVAALGSETSSWVALKEGAVMPEELLAAIGRFDAGPHPAAIAAAEWLRTIALGSSSARTWLLVCGDRVLAYCALASAAVPLTRRQRVEVGSAYRQTPATLVAWAAKAADAGIDGRAIIGHAVSVAIEVRRLQGDLRAGTRPVRRASCGAVDRPLRVSAGGTAARR